MVRASAQTQRAHESLMQEHRVGQQQSIAREQNYGNLGERGEARKQQGKQFDASMEERQHQFNVTSDQRTRGQEFQEAQAGFERTDKPMSSREQRLADQMEQGGQVGPMDPEAQNRLKGQAEQQMQADSATSPYQQTELGREREEFARGQAANRALTNRINAEAALQNATNRFNQSRVAGNKEAMAKERNVLLAPARQGIERFNRLMTDKGSEADWVALRKEAETFDDGMQADLQADLKAGQWTPRTQAFAAMVNAKNGLKFVAATGEMPMDDDGNMLIDTGSPVYRNFEDGRQMVHGYMRMLNPLATYAGVNSIQTKNQFMNKFAASAVLSGLIQNVPESPIEDPGRDPQQEQGGQGVQLPQQSVQPAGMDEGYGGQPLTPQGPDQAAGFMRDAR